MHNINFAWIQTHSWYKVYGWAVWVKSKHSLIPANNRCKFSIHTKPQHNGWSEGRTQAGLSHAGLSHVECIFSLINPLKATWNLWTTSVEFSKASRHFSPFNKANLPSASSYRPVHIWSTSEGMEEGPAVRVYNAHPILSTAWTGGNLKGWRSGIVTGRWGFRFPDGVRKWPMCYSVSVVLWVPAHQKVLKHSKRCKVQCTTVMRDNILRWNCQRSFLFL